MLPLARANLLVSIKAPSRLISRSLHFFISIPSLANTFTSVTRRGPKRRLVGNGLLVKFTSITIVDALLNQYSLALYRLNEEAKRWEIHGRSDDIQHAQFNSAVPIRAGSARGDVGVFTPL
jgi:hypothetical protein